ncbi:bile acid:sodium symporter family protein [Streptomyces sp. SID5914]|nr:bile acid:sodium symporter family protein [Streptomyces sp. SID5914]MZG19369.1 bile acid:sodium symporter family protein [Streptomyces sp. SID5914]
MNSTLASVGLPLALAVIMFGLGLSLTTEDFARIARHPKVVAIALACQVVLLPLAAFGLVVLFDLEPLLAVGMVLLAASPGGITANLFSHLFGGDVALNISLTAVNSIIAVVTVPVVTNVAIDHFEPAGLGAVGLQFGKMVQVFAIVLVPVVIGMWVRHIRAGFAVRMDRPVRIGSALILLMAILGTMVSERSNLAGYFMDVGAVAALFCLVSLTAGYWIPRLLGADRRQGIACSMEVGIHNSALAITMAVGVLGSSRMAVPAAVYGAVMAPLALLVGWSISRRTDRAHAARTRSGAADVITIDRDRADIDDSAAHS